MLPTGIAEPASFISLLPGANSNNNLYLRKLLRAAAILFGALLMLPAEHSLAQALYQAPATFSVGTTPQGVVAADFWHTGYVGLVVANSASDTMTVYPGSANATFGTPTTISTCPAPGQAISADFNNDGYPDVAIACTGASEVEVFLNNQTGGFGAGTTITVAASPAALVAGDFNSDGYADLVVACGTSGTAAILLTNGASISTGHSTTSSTIPGSNLTAIAAGKFDTSGHLDVALVDAVNSIVIIAAGDGTGNFTVSDSEPLEDGADSIVTGDWDHNGTTDLAVLNSGAGSVSIFFGNGNGTFTGVAEVIPLVLPHAAIGGVSMVELDVNGDGNLDLVAGSETNNSLYMLLGNSDGTFQASQQIAGDGNNTDYPTQTYPVPNGPADLAVGDFNRDGKPDIAVTEQNGGAVALLLNNTLPTPEPGGDSFGVPIAMTNMNGNMADSIAAADFDHDGYPDAAVAYLEDNVVRVLLHGNTGAPASYAVGSQPYDVVSGDLNGDGYADLVTANATDGTISVLLNHGASGNGAFSPAVTYTVGHFPYQVAIGDLNGDHIPDLAVTNSGDNTVSILYGASGGTFTAGPTLSTGTAPFGVAIGNFHNNDVNDIAVTCNSSFQLYVFPNNGSGTFGSPNIYSTDSNPAGLVVGDFNRDGRMDIVTGNTIANDISFFAGNGDGTFQPGVISASRNFPVSIEAGDVNGDGILDIVGVASNAQDVVITLGKGDGTFAQHVEFAAGQQPWAVALADFNNDGKLDIATANTYDQVNIVPNSYIGRYMTQYPPVSGGNPSVDLLLNLSGTQVTLGESPNSYSPLAYNAPITLTATVASTLGGVTPTGSLIFEDNGGLVLGTAPSALSSGTASLTLPSLGSGLHILTALYSGDTNYQPNNTATNPGFLVFIAGTTVSLTATPSTVVAGNNFTYTATVGIAGDGSDPTGTVTLYGILPSGAVQVFDSAQTLVGNGNGTASASHSINPGVAPGNYEIVAAFTPAGGSIYAAGSSPDEPLMVTGQPTSTTLSCVPETYFGFPTGEDECYSQILANSTVLEQGTVDFAINGGSQSTETIQDYTPNYYTPTLNGYYATYIFAAPEGTYPATSIFQLQQISGTYYSESSASGTF